MEKISLKQLKAIFEEEDCLAALCNSVAFLKEITPDINWLGYYFLKNDELVLGPFQGKVACTHLKLSQGVCAKAYNDQKMTNIPNVHEFPTHIACDSASNSELVLPLYRDKTIIGVLDIDSPIINRFDSEDEIFFSEAANIISQYLSK